MMSKFSESSGKKNIAQKKKKKRQDKIEKMEERRLISKKGKPLQDMLAYVDANGVITDTPPDPEALKKARESDMFVMQAENGGAGVRNGTVQFFDSEKGFGFILDEQTKGRIFFHFSMLEEPVLVNDAVEFIIKPGQRGPAAENIRKKP